jgi:hypothetical protein
VAAPVPPRLRSAALRAGRGAVVGALPRVLIRLAEQQGTAMLPALGQCLDGRCTLTTWAAVRALEALLAAHLEVVGREGMAAAMAESGVAGKLELLQLHGDHSLTLCARRLLGLVFHTEEVVLGTDKSGALDLSHFREIASPRSGGGASRRTRGE